MPLVHPLELLTSSRLWLALPQLLVILLVSWLAVWLGSRLIERVVVRLPVPYDADLRQVEAIINATGKALGQDPSLRGD